MFAGSETHPSRAVESAALEASWLREQEMSAEEERTSLTVLKGETASCVMETSKVMGYEKEADQKGKGT